MAAPSGTETLRASGYRVEYRNLLHEWVPDLRKFTREEALATARRVREQDTRRPRHIQRILRTRVLRACLPPANNPYVPSEERFSRIEAVMRGDST